MKIKRIKTPSYKYYKRECRRQQVAGALRLLIVLLLVACPLYDNYRAKNTSLEPTKQTKRVEVVPDIPQEKNVNEISWNDAIRELFPKDEVGLIIRICIAENKAQNKTAMNTNDNGSYDYSWCQINSVHKPKSMSHSDWLSNLEDPRFHAKEVRRIYLSQGYNAWTVYKKGLIK